MNYLIYKRFSAHFEKIPENVMLVTADLVDLHSSIPHKADLSALN